MYFFTFYVGKPGKFKVVEKNYSNLFIHIILHLKNGSPKDLRDYLSFNHLYISYETSC